jgi:hypothetical protein
MTVISAASLNTDMAAITTEILTEGEDTGVSYSHSLDVLDLVDTTSVGLRTLDITSPDDAQLITLHLRCINSVAVAKTITATLTAISSDETEVADYLNQQTVSAAATFSTAATHYASDDFTSTSETPVFLLKGVTYRLTLTNSGSSNVDRVVATLTVRGFKRRA